MGTKTPGRRMGGFGSVRLEAGANHSSEVARMEEWREEEMRSFIVTISGCLEN